MKTLMILFGLLISQAIAGLIGVAPYGRWAEPFFTVDGLAPLLTVAEAADSSFTQADRDRITWLEEGLKAINQRLDDNLKAINQRFDAINQRIDDNIKAINQKFDYVIGLMYVMLSGMFVLVGFILWDRRTTFSRSRSHLPGSCSKNHQGT
ncbi:MAG: hypothetical protein HQL03_10660 [Nitrospirae bacterium]|nr:hypothetical protein [Nitrospirota bacterium]